MTNLPTLESLLEKWDEQRGRGHEVSLEELCVDRPDLLPEVRQQIDQLKFMDWLDGPADDEGSTASSGDVSQRILSVDSRLGPAKLTTLLAGRYELLSLIAEGGFGQVWRAKDRSLDRLVAVKVTTVNCFLEARRVAQLKHHGIVTVHDVGNADGLCYIVFDLVEGRTLADRIQRGTVAWQDAARIVAEVADSVQFAHDKGFIHRDIKPANILLDENGSPVLADFGIAVTGCELRHEAVTSIGTLAYMAPEQLERDGVIDVRTDVYGLGVVLYELLTGRRPFHSETLTGLRDQILAGNPPSPRRLEPLVLEQVSAICVKSLSPLQSDRFPTAKSFADALRQTIESSGSD